MAREVVGNHIRKLVHGKPIRKPVEVSSSVLKAYEGWYQVQKGGFKGSYFQAKLVGGELHVMNLAMGGFIHNLLPQSAATFECKMFGQSKLFNFKKGINGKVTGFGTKMRGKAAFAKKTGKAPESEMH